ncbi:MAG: endopeptidase La [Polyangiaceae bacterium]
MSQGLAETFPLLPLRSGVLFPEGTMSLTVGREKSVALVEALRPGAIFAVVTQKNGKIEDPRDADLHTIGTFAKLVSITQSSRREPMRITIEGTGRVRLGELRKLQPYLQAVGTPLLDEHEKSPEAVVLVEELGSLLKEVTGKTGAFEDLLGDKSITPARFADRVAAALGLDVDDAMELLATTDVTVRLRKLVGHVLRQKEMAELRSKIGDDVRKEIGKNQREAILREQLKAIKKELGDEKDDDLTSLRKKLDAAELPEDARKQADRELERLEQTGGQGAEANVIRSYLEWIAALPWEKRAEVKEDLDAIAAKLDADHAGLEDIKKRVLEHMAVRKLSKSEKGTILCFVGPPGVGKTSLGQSIADATGRPFQRVSLGGVRDEAEIRGHRRTYVGALPGRLIHALKKVQVKNPVILLDEIDKLSNMWGGAAESALLEVLDPEQNKSFTDHYMELAFDLSEVFFIATANTLDTLSAPLRDRLEIIELSGYTPPEKTSIATRHLIPKRVKEAGIPTGVVQISSAALSEVIEKYTREAGVRQLDREITRLLRSVALDVARHAEGTPLQVLIEPEDVSRILGKPKFRNDVRERTSLPGVATGLAWTPVGGDILFIETSKMKGKGRLEITGQLGDVMKESARAALTYVRSHADALGITADSLEDADLHLHVPAGAVPKDGPSAGVTIFTALASLLTSRRVRPDTAMTGECTLRGRVLPVGGIKSKVLAAHRAGIRRVVLPKDNERDLDDVPEDVRHDMTFILAEDMREVLAAALESMPDIAPSSGSSGGGEKPLD